MPIPPNAFGFDSEGPPNWGIFRLSLPEWTSAGDAGMADAAHQPNCCRSLSEFMAIAQEIQAYGNENYPGISSANPGTMPADSADMATTTSTSKVPSSLAP